MGDRIPLLPSVMWAARWTLVASVCGVAVREAALGSNETCVNDHVVLVLTMFLVILSAAGEYS